MANLVQFENYKENKTDARKVLFGGNHVATIKFKSDKSWTGDYKLVPIPGTEKWVAESVGKYGNEVNLTFAAKNLKDVKTEVTKRINTHSDIIKGIDKKSIRNLNMSATSHLLPINGQGWAAKLTKVNGSVYYSDIVMFDPELMYGNDSNIPCGVYTILKDLLDNNQFHLEDIITFEKIYDGK